MKLKKEVVKMGMDALVSLAYGISSSHDEWDEDAVYEFAKENGLDYGFAGDFRDNKEGVLILGFGISTSKDETLSLDQDEGARKLDLDYIADEIAKVKEKFTPELLEKIQEFLGEEEKLKPDLIQYINITA